MDDRLCTRDEIVEYENSNPVESEVTDDDLFCIYYDNSEYTNLFSFFLGGGGGDGGD